MLVDKFISLIIHAEKKHKLFDFKFKNLSVWSYYRMYFYYRYTSDLNIYENSVSGFNKDIKYFLSIINIFNIKKLFEKKEYFILEHPRSNKDKVDIYTYDIVQDIGEDKCSFFSFSHNGLIHKKKRVIVLDVVKICSKIVSKILYRGLSSNKFNSFKLFLEELKADDKLPYINGYKRYYIELIVQYYFYTFLLKIKNTKKVILVVSYYNMPLIFAAKNLNIEVIEMQHGVISEYHLGYHYPYFETDFFPDKFYTFSEFWNDSASFPNNSDVISIGNSFLCNKNIKRKKIRNTIVIVSQTTIGNILQKYLLKNTEHLKDYVIYYKLHPNEYNDFKEKYKNLLNIENIKFISNEYSLSDLQQFCEYQIGVYSTGIYEGLEKECKTILLNAPGTEYMEQLIDNNLVILVNDFEQRLDKIFCNAKVVKNVKFFDCFNENKIKKEF